MDTGDQIAYGGLHRAACLAASIAGARGPVVDEVADEAMALLLLNDGSVNNPKAWVRSLATRLVRESSTRQRLNADEVLRGLTPTERSVLVGHRAGFTVREICARFSVDEAEARRLVAEASRKVRSARAAVGDVTDG